MKNKIFQIALTVTCLLGIMACDQEGLDDGISNGMTKESLRFVVFDNAVSQSNSSGSASHAAPHRAATTSAGAAMITTFEVGDQAGLYVVKGGNVLYGNVKLTYNVSGFWEPVNAIDVTDEISGAQFYAYYPYSEDAKFNASSSEPFAEMVNDRVPDGRQSNKSSYEAADIMVTGATAIGEYNTVQLPLCHQKAMVCVELPNSSYIFTNTGIDPYVVAKAENATFTLNGNTVQPYFDDATQSYRLIVEPSQSGTLNVSFTNNGEKKSFEATNLSSIHTGQYAKYVIDGGASLVTMTLQVGDYYCADGKLVPKDTPASELPDNIVGVVVKVGTTDAISAANSNWSHAVVLSMQSKAGAKWGTKGSTSSAENAAGWRYWYESNGLADQNRKTSAAQLDEDIMAEEGYEVTKAWRAVPQPLEIGGLTLDYTSVMNTTMDDWIDANPLPSGICTGWYIPSLGDWKNVDANLSTITSQLSNAGGTALAWPCWSCNIRAAGSNWCYVAGKTALADRYKGVTCSSSSTYRFMFAF